MDNNRKATSEMASETSPLSSLVEKINQLVCNNSDARYREVMNAILRSLQNPVSGNCLKGILVAYPKLTSKSTLDKVIADLRGAGIDIRKARYWTDSLRIKSW